jgi:hypothetical protein
MSKNGDFQICPQTYLKDLKTSSAPVRDAWQKREILGRIRFKVENSRSQLLLVGVNHRKNCIFGLKTVVTILRLLDLFRTPLGVTGIQFPLINLVCFVAPCSHLLFSTEKKFCPESEILLHLEIFILFALSVGVPLLVLLHDPVPVPCTFFLSLANLRVFPISPTLPVAVSIELIPSLNQGGCNEPLVFTLFAHFLPFLWRKKSLIGISKQDVRSDTFDQRKPYRLEASNSSRT